MLHRNNIKKDVYVRVCTFSSIKLLLLEYLLFEFELVIDKTIKKREVVVIAK